MLPHICGVVDDGDGGSAPGGGVWRAALACLFGGISEELPTSLFLMSLIALGLRTAVRAPRGTLPAWTAIALAAILFGAGHLPMAAKLLPLTGPVVAVIIGLNAIGGVAFGWLY